MSSLKSQQPEVENRILAALPKKQYGSLFSKLQPVSLPIGHLVFEQNRPIRFIYFPLTAMLSLLSMGEDGNRGVEVCTVGNEGVAGVAVFLNGDLAINRAIVQLPGTALRIEAKAFRDILSQRGLLNRLLELYTQVQLTSISRSVFCNCFHKVEKRLARWLLLTHDRARTDTFPMTQEFAAYLLGLHRPAVSIAANALQGVGLIRYSHGKITILDREGLEATACECYRIVERAYDHLLGDLLPAESSEEP